MRAGVTSACGILSAAWLVVAGCTPGDTPPMTDQLERGRAAIRSYGCGTCHVIPGVPGANGEVGPPLSGIADRVYLGGVLPNLPEEMVRWIRWPQKVDPRTAMPDLDVSDTDARNIAAYLYTLK